VFVFGQTWQTSQTMKLELIRTYFPKGTNGTLFLDGIKLCYCIELPWHNNNPSISCIPEGTYELKKRYSPKHQWHVIVTKVPGRQYILIHAANDAIKELKGCIAPVSELTAPGKGNKSRVVVAKLYAHIFDALEKMEPVFLTIKSEK
jgi:hypothetical protein